MTAVDLLPASLLRRKAVVYVRQSTQSQVMTNLESGRRQYDLVDVARQHGFMDERMVDGHPINRLDDLLPWNWTPTPVNP